VTHSNDDLTRLARPDLLVPLNLQSGNRRRNGDVSHIRFSVDESRVILRLFLSAVLRQRQEPGVMVDVGAFRGTSFDGFLDQGWIVHAFEPQQDRFAALQQKYANLPVHLSQLAVTDSSTDLLPFFESDESPGISSLIPFRSSHIETQKVSTIRLDHYFRTHRLGTVEFLKIDAEGADFSVLKGLDLTRNTPIALMCEYENAKTQPLGHSFVDVGTHLMENGYEVFVSEWYPIVRYGGGHHRWKAIRPWGDHELVDPDSWGNLLAFKPTISHRAILSAFAVEVSCERYRVQIASLGSPQRRSTPKIGQRLKLRLARKFPLTVRVYRGLRSRWHRLVCLIQGKQGWD